MKQVALVLCSSICSALLAVLIYRYFEQPKEVIIRESKPVLYANYDMPNQNINIPLNRMSDDFVASSALVTSSVVNIRVGSSSAFDFFSSNNNFETSSGSGVIISSDGYIVTNNHVISQGNQILITLSDRREFEAKKIGTDPSTDLALLKIEATKLPYLPFGNSDSLRVGEWVLAVGNPFNLESTVTAGIVSAKGRNINILDDQYSIESFIQTDAMVNPGNSGGALVDVQGRLIGINTAIMTRSGHFEGYSFAIPSNLALKVIQDIQDFGEVQRGILGVNIEQVDSKLARKLGLGSVAGVHIGDLREGGGAEEGGLKKGDVIIGVNGVSINTVPELQEQVGRFHPGEALEIEYIRKGKKAKTKVKLKSKENGLDVASYYGERDLLSNMGFEVRDVNKTEEKRIGKKGIKVTSVFKGSKIAATNMEPDFVIQKINDIEISNIEELVVAIEMAEDEIVFKGIYENYVGDYVYKLNKLSDE
jgi:Do/DeqQ family serine protease